MGAETYEDLTTEIASFKLNFPDFPGNPSQNWFNSMGGGASVQATQLLAKTTLEAMAAIYAGFSVDEHGKIVKDGKFYGTPHLFHVSSSINGELTVGSISDPSFGSDSHLKGPESLKIEDVFAGGQQISNAKIIVKVD